MQILALISVIIAAFFIGMNFQEIISFNVISELVGGIIHFPPVTKHINLALFAGIMYSLGLITILTFVCPLYFSLKEKFTAYKRELERGSISNSNGEAKIQVLENKITVLEKALDEALKKRNN